MKSVAGGAHCRRSGLRHAGNFRLDATRHTGHNVSTRSGVTLKDTMVRAGQSSEKAALIYRHSDVDRQREVVAEIDAAVWKRWIVAAGQQASGTDLARGS